MVASICQCVVLALFVWPVATSAFCPAQQALTRSSRSSSSRKTSLCRSTTENKNFAQTLITNDPPHFMDYLKFDGNPTFDVVAKTKEYVASRPTNPESFYSEEYCLRGPVIGPFTRKELTDTQAGFEYDQAFPDLTTETFGFVTDPENPYRCLWFEKWRATHTGTLQAGPQTLEATGKRMVTPLMTFFVVWNPQGKIVYESVGNVVDRHEGNTAGKGAVFGLFQTAGYDIPSQPGSLVLRIQQRLGQMLGLKSFSDEETIPSWWKSKSRGADPIDPAESAK